MFIIRPFFSLLLVPSKVPVPTSLSLSVFTQLTFEFCFFYNENLVSIDTLQLTFEFCFFYNENLGKPSKPKISKNWKMSKKGGWVRATNQNSIIQNVEGGGGPDVQFFFSKFK